MTEPTTDLPAERDAYALLSKPTLSLTEDEVEAVVKDLRRRRDQWLDGVKDQPAKTAKPKALPKTAEEKKALTDQLAASISLNLDL